MFVDFVHGRYGILLVYSQFLIMQMCKSLHYHSDKSPDSDSMMLGPISTVMERRWLGGYLAICLHGHVYLPPSVPLRTERLRRP